MSGWPRSLFDWDVLFLLPLPWWGPVLAPVSIAVLMIVWGTIVTESPERREAVPAHDQSVGAECDRHCTRALRFHGRLAGAVAPPAKRHDLRLANFLQLAAVQRRAHPDGRALGCLGGQTGVKPGSERGQTRVGAGSKPERRYRHFESKAHDCFFRVPDNRLTPV